MENLRHIGQSFLFLFPPLALAGLGMGWFRTGFDRHSLTLPVLLFVGAGVMGVFPRADGGHLSSAVPELLLGLMYAWKLSAPRIAVPWRHLARAGLVVWVGLWLRYLAADSVVWFSSGHFRVSTLPHYRGILAHRAWHAKVEEQARALIGLTAGEQPFLLSPYAGFYYLVTGLKNPTPFDLPLSTSMGRHGVAKTMAAIARGQIRVVVFDAQIQRDMPLRPVLLERYVQETMVRGQEVGDFTVYRTATLGVRTR